MSMVVNDPAEGEEVPIERHISQPHLLRKRGRADRLCTLMESQPLQRVLGAPTAWLIGLGVAIGSGIFRTPGEVAAALPSTALILCAWFAGGLIVLIQGMVTAELATRHPRAGGEYVFLREAYGEFTAFFFGWAYTIFIIGGGAAAIALAFGDFTCELLGLAGPVISETFAGENGQAVRRIGTGVTWSGAIATAAIVAVTVVNALGVRIGAVTQNILTCVKIVALLAVVVVGFLPVSQAAAAGPEAAPPPAGLSLSVFLAAMLPALWAYSGTTDSVKMAEEIRDVRRALPLAIIGSTSLLIVIYAAFNLALIRLVPPAQMAGLSFVPGEAMVRRFGEAGRNAMLVAAMLVCLGALSSALLATIRVTFALARDGLAFRFLAGMSKSQSPVAALFVVAAFAVVLVLNRDFMRVLEIYFFAAAILFGLTYASLIVFRLRESAVPGHVFRCPFGIVLAGLMVLFQFALAVNIAVHDPRNTLYTLALLAALALWYLAWKRVPQIE